jgi:hypothetical protein
VENRFFYITFFCILCRWAKLTFLESTLPDGFFKTHIDLFHEKNFPAYIVSFWLCTNLIPIFAKKADNVEERILHICLMIISSKSYYNSRKGMRNSVILQLWFWFNCIYFKKLSLKKSCNTVFSLDRLIYFCFRSIETPKLPFSIFNRNKRLVSDSVETSFVSILVVLNRN